MTVVVVVALAAGVWVVVRPRSTPTYAAFRETRNQELPGSFGLTMAPVPGSFQPAISPARAVRIASQGQTAPGPVYVVLAEVSPAYLAVGSTVPGPAWIVIVRNLCFAGEKGELVSQTRQPAAQQKRCSMNNLWAQVIDASTGARVSVGHGFDASGGTWIPATTGSSA